MNYEPAIQIRMKDWARLPIALRQELLLHIPEVWLIWKPYISFMPWWGRWEPRNVSDGRCQQNMKS